MTIKLEVGHTYRTRDGAEYTIDRIGNNIASEDNSSLGWWADTGRMSTHHMYTGDLVEEATHEAPGPVRRRTVTRTEIVPGVYGNVHVTKVFQTPDCDAPNKRPTPGVDLEVRATFYAEDLDALAATATELAAALRAISAEKGTA